MKEKAPLALFVVWHPGFQEGITFANLIFSEFKRNVNDPLSRGMNIPVYFRFVKPLADIPDDYRFTVVIALIDPLFMISNEHVAYLQSLHEDSRDGFLIIPVAVEKTALNVSLGSLNFARLYEKDAKAEYLTSIIAHETARHLYHLPERSASSMVAGPPSPLKLFISHAKADGVEIATALKAYVEKSLPLKTFFDANDIAIAYDFSKEIERYIQDTVIIAIHTDMYSSREWCRREILLAKENNRPMVVLNCFLNGESRSFPYMANVLTVHYASLEDDGKQSGTSVWSKVITAVLKETLRLRYQELWMDYVGKVLDYDLSSVVISAYPPELVTVLKKIDQLNGTFIYPDPPLGREEIAIIELMSKRIRPSSDVNFLTPSQL